MFCRKISDISEQMDQQVQGQLLWAPKFYGMIKMVEETKDGMR